MQAVMQNLMQEISNKLVKLRNAIQAMVLMLQNAGEDLNSLVSLLQRLNSEVQTVRDENRSLRKQMEELVFQSQSSLDH